jgi:hypothetical protein
LLSLLMHRLSISHGAITPSIEPHLASNRLRRTSALATSRLRAGARGRRRWYAATFYAAKPDALGVLSACKASAALQAFAKTAKITRLWPYDVARRIGTCGHPIVSVRPVDRSLGGKSRHAHDVAPFRFKDVSTNPVHPTFVGDECLAKN